jgi:superfamily II DNA or RNA helicase
MLHPSHLEVSVSTHNFSCKVLSPRGRWLCNQFASKFVSYEWLTSRGVTHKVASRVFAAATADRNEFRFHINTLNEFKEFLIYHHTHDNLITWIQVPLYEPVQANFIVKKHWKPREDQIPAIEYLTQVKPISKLLPLQTGTGKSMMSMLAEAIINKRVVMIIKPMYIEKWIADYVKTYEIEIKDIMVVQGAASLMALLELARTDQLEQNIIIISNTTFQNYIKDYEKYRDDIVDLGYACSPNKFFEFVKAGVRAIDEVHMAFHLCFKIDLYTNVPCSISLSATLINNDHFMVKMYETAYPLKERYAEQALKKYIDAFAVHYRFKDFSKIRTENRGARGYSHLAFEESIMGNKDTLQNYLKLIDYVMNLSFMDNPKKDKKLLIFASMVEMCTYIRDYLLKKYPQYDTRRYTSFDEYSDLIECQIGVSTLGSSGTLVDLPGLCTTIMTVAVDSSAANVQALGRLRELKDSSTEFYYFTCSDVDKHIAYHNRKKEMLEQRAKSIRDIYTGIVV